MNDVFTYSIKFVTPDGDSTMTVKVPYACTPENIANEYELVIECGYGIANADFGDIIDVSAYEAVSISHDDVTIMEF